MSHVGSPGRSVASQVEIGHLTLATMERQGTVAPTRIPHTRIGPHGPYWTATVVRFNHGLTKHPWRDKTLVCPHP